MSRGFLSEPDYNHKPYDNDYDDGLMDNYSDEQCCLNCRYFKISRRIPGYCKGYCTHHKRDMYDCPPDYMDCCDLWEGKRV